MIELHQYKNAALETIQKVGAWVICDILLNVKYTFVQDINIFARNNVVVHNGFAVWLLHLHINANIANQLFMWNSDQRINYKVIFEATNAIS